MEKNSLLANKALKSTLIVAFILAIGVLAFFLLKSKKVENEPLVMALSPYQDLAMIVNIDNLGLEKKYGVDVELRTMAWEEILTSVASAGKTVDVGFGSLVEYITQENNLNKGDDNDILFLYPAYIYKGGGFVSIDKSIPILSKENIKDENLVKQFLSKRIGAQKNSIYEMMIFSLANRNGIDFKSLKMFDITLGDGIYALENKSLDLTQAGLTQKNEIINRGGQINLTVEDLGFADVTGFICKKSTYLKKKEQIDALIKMWYDCVAYVMADLDNNSKQSMEYLRKNASTQYTIEQYKEALSQEYFPLSVTEANREIIDNNGIFSYEKISEDVANYLVATGVAKQKPQIPVFITVNE
ncbi:hypothetical protein FACS1894174_03980 [Bacteroidia bacterium]|nr:hypothetical protein FACS1894174_03980 [Bacteroidia bacterium]